MICLMESPLTRCLNPGFDLLFPRNMEEREIRDSMLFWNRQLKKWNGQCVFCLLHQIDVKLRYPSAYD